MAGKSDGRRIARVEKEVHGFVSQYLASSYKGEIPGFVSVSRVKMPGDLRSARVHVSFIGTTPVEQKQALILLQKRAPEIQRIIGDRMPMKYCPKLTFELDETTEKILKIENILKDLDSERAKTAPTDTSPDADTDKNAATGEDDN